MFNEQTNLVPAEALMLQVGIEFGDNGEDAKTAPVKLLARTHAINHPYWGQIEHDFGGMQHKSRIPLDFCHDQKEIVGYANRFDITDEGLVLSGAITPYKDDRASEIVHKQRLGVPYEASIDFRGSIGIEKVVEGQQAEVNGHTFDGPGFIVRKWTLRGCAVCPHGADSNTSTTFSDNQPGEYPVEIMENKQMSENTPVETVPAVVETPAPAEVVPTVEAQLTPAPETTEAPAAPAPVAPVVEDPAAIAKKFQDAYGVDGLQWMAEGKTFAECKDLQLAKVIAENADMKTRLGAISGDGSFTVPPVSNTPAPAAPEKNKPQAPQSLTSAEKLIFECLNFK